MMQHWRYHLSFLAPPQESWQAHEAMHPEIALPPPTTSQCQKLRSQSHRYQTNEMLR